MDEYEGIARRYCELMGIDPDQEVGHEADPGPDGFVPGVCVISPRWRLVAKEAKSQIAWLQAIGLYSAPSANGSSTYE